MTAISKSWVTLTDAATDADSPVDQALVQGIRDDLVHLREWLGADYYAGAAQNHNHDGVGSALVEVGPNAIRNGSFEAGLEGWTTAAYTGGTIATNASNNMDGATCLAITSTVLANGGGTATSNEFRTCTAGGGIFVQLAIKASAANISAKVEVAWYDEAQAAISTSIVYSSSSTPTTATAVGNVVAAPATACYYKVRLTGGVPATGSAVGTVYFDGVVAGTITNQPYDYSTVATTSGTSQTIASIPAYANELEIYGSGISFLSNDTPNLLIGDAGGLESTGYSCTNDSNTTRVTLSTLANAADSISIRVNAWRLPGTNTWDFHGWAVVNTLTPVVVSGRKTLSATLDRVAISGTGATFDAGSFTVKWSA